MLFRLIVAAALLTPVASRAASYDALYVFGDSLSDRGNLAETGIVQALAKLPPINYPFPPSFHDSFTNGPVAVSALAAKFGLVAEPSLWVTGFKDVNNLFGGAGYVPGTNYAVAGATSQFQAPGGPSSINLPQQLAVYSIASGGVADPNALYTVLIGGNDVRNAALQGGGAAGAAAIAAGVQTEVAAVSALVKAGARNLLVINVPDVGLIPEFTQDHPAADADARAFSSLYNAGLSAGLNALALPAGTSLSQFDLFAFNNLIASNAAALGFTNATDRCFVAAPLSAEATAACGPGGANIGQYVYWDAIHPTARVQALWADGAAAVLAGNASPSPVPEPATMVLLAAGLAALGATRSRRSK